MTLDMSPTVQAIAELIATPTQRSVRSKYRLQVLSQGKFVTVKSYRSRTGDAYLALAAQKKGALRTARLVNHEGTPIAHNTTIDVDGVEKV